MNVIQTLPRWASLPIQKLADREPNPNLQTAPVDQDTFNQSSEMAVGLINLAASDEVEGEDLAMGQPGVVSPQAGVEMRFTGDPSSASGTLEAVVENKDAKAAMYLRSGPSGYDTIVVMEQGPMIVGQAVYVEQTAMGISGEQVAGVVG
jgi:hypothetical protein